VRENAGQKVTKEEGLKRLDAPGEKKQIVAIGMSGRGDPHKVSRKEGESPTRDYGGGTARSVKKVHAKMFATGQA